MKQKKLIWKLFFSVILLIGLCNVTTMDAKNKITTTNYQKIYISSGTKYNITKVVKYLKKEELRSKKIQWKCNSKDVKITKNGYFRFLKDGNYKFVGRKGKSQKFVIPIVVQTNIMPNKDGIIEILIRHSGMTARLNNEVDVSLTEKSQIEEFLYQASHIKANLDVKETYKKPLSGSEGYDIIFKYNTGNSIKWDLNGSIISLMDIKMYPNGETKIDYESKRAFKCRNAGDFLNYVVSIYQKCQND